MKHDPHERGQWQRALNALPTLQRTAFTLHTWDGMSFSQVARRTGLSAAEIEALFADALLRLDRRIGTISSREAVAHHASAD